MAVPDMPAPCHRPGLQEHRELEAHRATIARFGSGMKAIDAIARRLRS